MAAPHGVTEYVRTAMEFSNWAFKTDEEHAASLAEQKAVSATLAANQCLQALCDFSLTGDPAALTSSTGLDHPTSMARNDTPASYAPAGAAHASGKEASHSASKSMCEPSARTGDVEALMASHSLGGQLQTPALLGESGQVGKHAADPELVTAAAGGYQFECQNQGQADADAKHTSSGTCARLLCTALHDTFLMCLQPQACLAVLSDTVCYLALVCMAM